MSDMIFCVNGVDNKDHLVVPVEKLQDKLNELKAMFPGSIYEERRLVLYKKEEIYQAIDELFSEVLNCGPGQH